MHPAWRSEWRSTHRWDLGDLRAELFDLDAAPEERVELTAGVGRNCTTFDQLRLFAYGQCVAFKSDGGTIEGWRARITELAVAINQQFSHPMSVREVRGIAMSVAASMRANVRRARTGPGPT